MSDIPDTTDRATGGNKPGASWLRIWWPAFLICGSIALGVAVILQISTHTFAGSGMARVANDVNALAVSIERFESEYEKLPDVPVLDFETEGSHAADLVTVLLGKEETGSSMQNHRQIPFLNIRGTRSKHRGGLVFSPEHKALGIYDVWGNPLRVILRPPGQSAITIPHGQKQATIRKPAVVLSRGKDGTWGTKDDIVSAASDL